jgi:hypothetical protein
MIACSFLLTLFGALCVAAAPLQRRTNVELMVLTDADKYPEKALSQGDIRVVSQVGPEALQAVKDTLAVLAQPNFEQTGLFKTFLDRETNVPSAQIHPNFCATLLDASRVAMQTGVFQQLEEVLERSFPLKPEQHVAEMSQDGEHTTIMKDGEKGTAKARSVL